LYDVYWVLCEQNGESVRITGFGKMKIVLAASQHLCHETSLMPLQILFRRERVGVEGGLGRGEENRVLSREERDNGLSAREGGCQAIDAKHAA